MRPAPVLLFVLLAASGCVGVVGDEAAAAVDAAPPDAMADAALPSLCDEGDPSTTLGLVPGLAAVEEAACGELVSGLARCFHLEIEQPVDQRAGSGPSFRQHLWLVHRGCDRPTLVADWGYANDQFYDDELSVLYQTNSLWIEHRFQGASTPALADWDWASLTIENGAADMHRVIAALKPFYTRRWVSTGASKGGITAVYHRYFHPDDVDGSVPYVAPASRARTDAAYQEYLGTALPAACAQGVRDFQVAALTTRRPLLVQRIDQTIGAGFGPLFVELYTMYFDWSFWQRRGAVACVSVPAAGASDDAFWHFFEEYSGISDPDGSPAVDAVRTNAALEYEWLTEQGFALQVGAHVADLLTDPLALETREDRFRADFPEVVLPDFDGSVTAAVRRWAREDAERMLLIYGEYDPWSGGALDEPLQPTARRFFVPAATHGAALTHLPTFEREAALALASTMFGREPMLARLSAARRAAATRERLLDRAVRRQRAIAAHRALRARGPGPSKAVKPATAAGNR